MHTESSMNFTDEGYRGLLDGDNLIVEPTINMRLHALRKAASSLASELALITENDSQSSAINGLDETLKMIEIRMIRSALRLTGGNQTKAARLLRIKLTTLNAKIHRHGIEITDFADLKLPHKKDIGALVGDR